MATWQEKQQSVRDNKEDTGYFSRLVDEVDDFFGKHPQPGTMASVLRQHILHEHGFVPQELTSTDKIVIRCAELQLNAFARRLEADGM